MQPHHSPIKKIDVGAILRAKAGPKARFVPGFVVRRLEKFIHQDFLNVFLEQRRVGVDFCRGSVEYLGVTVDVEGLDHLPHDGRLCTFVSNHPLGAIDGVTLGWIIGEQYEGRIKYLVNELLMNLEGLAPLCVPINKTGKQSRNLPAMMDAAFGGRDHVIMFPAGLCSRQQPDGTIRDLPWNKAFLKKSLHTGRHIVPIHFIGRNSPRFYRVARLCKTLHLPNLAMALLPDEMWRSRGGHYTVRIGRPIPPDTFDGTRTLTQWARWIQDQVYEL